MSEKSATPILVAGGVGTVVLLAVAWMFAASTSRQAVVNAEAYAAEKASLVAEVGDAEKPAEVVAEGDAAESAEADVAKAEEETTEIEVVKAEGDEPAAAEAEEVAQSLVAAVEEEKSEASAEATATAAAVTVAATTAVTASAGGDLKAGKKVFRKCKACHKIGEGAENAVGPYLTGIIGRVQGSAEGYEMYTDGFKAAMTAGTVWTAEEMDKFLIKPKDYMPGTRMAFGGLRKEADRANLIAYLSASE